MCHFDGGDCCGYDVNTQYCTECICFEDLICASPLALIGDGFCDDEANTAGCSYDGDDCCGDCANTDLCTECACHDEGALSLDVSCKLWKYNPNILENTNLHKLLLYIDLEILNFGYTLMFDSS